MPAGKFKILVINPGSTSTKLGLYADETQIYTTTLRHSDAELAPFRGGPILDQRDFRLEAIAAALAEAGWSEKDLDAVAGRGGLLPPLESGTYVVNEEMLEELRQAKRGEHASNLGAVLAHCIARKTGITAYVVDPVSVDELPKHARLSGSALFERQCLSHALNSKAVAKRYAREQGQSYESLRLIVAHLGSGISVSAHEAGRMVDVTNSREEGAFSTERAGSVPVMQLVDLCFAGRHTRAQVEAVLFREGGLYSYLGTKDLAEVERRMLAGGEWAKTVFTAMAYQIAKEIGAMAAVLRGKADALILTGGMAYSRDLVKRLREYTEWIAPVRVYPGEDELHALAEGVLRVLRGEEHPRYLSHHSAAIGIHVE